MSLSPYVASLRKHVGRDLILLPSVGAAVYDDEGRILLIKHNDHGHWVWPGGSCEPNEIPADSVVREVWEEAGLHVEPVSLLGVCGGPELEVHYRNGDVVSYVMTVFECRILGGALRADQVESTEVRFFDPRELKDLSMPPWAADVLPVLLSRGGTTGFQRATWRPQE